MRAALYARYSSDNQREASIADQLRSCRLHAERQGWTIVEEYSDHAVSGASMIRAGVQALLGDALRRRFDVVLTESLDRLSRDQEDIAGFYKRTLFAGIKIVTLAERDQRAARRPEGHDGRALPQGPGAEDPARLGRSGARRALRRRAVLRLRDRARDR